MENCKGDKVPLKLYFERILGEHREAIRIADIEREKTAQNVRRALEENMKAGDSRLEDHITHQIEQVHQALASLTSLMKERDARMDDYKVTEARQFQEFKETVTQRFNQVNEFRGALEDLNKMMATTKELDAVGDKIMPLIDRNRDEVGKKVSMETYNTALDEWRIWRGTMEKWRHEMAGKGEGISSTGKIAIGVVTFLALLLGIMNTISVFSKVNEKDNRPQQVEKR